MKRVMIFSFVVAALFLFSISTSGISDGNVSPKNSPETEACIGCHSSVTPGIVKDWFTSRHSLTIPEEALKKTFLERRVSATQIPDNLAKTVVGCYECHSLNPEAH